MIKKGNIKKWLQGTYIARCTTVDSTGMVLVISGNGSRQMDYTHIKHLKASLFGVLTPTITIKAIPPKSLRMISGGCAMHAEKDTHSSEDLTYLKNMQDALRNAQWFMGKAGVIHTTSETTVLNGE